MTSSEVKEFLSEQLPSVDFDADFLFSSLDSLGIATILYALAGKYGVHLSSEDVTPRNFRSVESITRMVRSKMTLEGRIHQHAVINPDKPAIICDGQTLSYSQLWEAIVQKAEELKASGLKPRRAYVFRAVQGAEFVVTYCAVHYLGAVAVPLERLALEENFARVSSELSEVEFGEDIADVLYTTGTTGKSKGAMISRTSLMACAENFIVDLKFSSDLLFIISGPLNHIASLFKLHPMLSIGGTVYIMDGLKDLNAFFKVFDLPFSKFGTFLVPASLRMIMQFAYDRLCSLADRFDLIETGAAPISSADMAQLSKALPNTRLYNTYGGTEIGCVASYEFNDGKYMEGCIGRPLKNAVLEVAQDGTLVVSGSTIMSGYVGDEESTRQVIIDGKVYMSDLGYVDEDGLIHLSGRKGDIINMGGYKVNPVEVENAAESFPGVADSLCTGTDHPVVGTVLKLIVVPEKGAQPDKKALANYLKGKLDFYKVPNVYEFAESVKYTYNGKKDRKHYLS